MVGLFPHIDKSIPALTVGAGVKVIIISSVSATQSPLPVVVSVNVNVPAAISKAVGVYVAANVFAFGAKAPAPPDHVPPVAPPTVPAKVVTALLAHLVWSTPASTVGALVNVITIISDTAVQVPFPVVVNVRFTNPAASSPAVGVYVAFIVILFGLKTPVPPDHTAPVATV